MAFQLHDLYKRVHQNTDLKHIQAPRSECVTENYFSYYSSATYVVGTLKNRLDEPKHMFKLIDKEIIAILRSFLFA